MMVELTDARFVEVKDVGDLRMAQALVVPKGQHGPRLGGKAGQRVNEKIARRQQPHGFVLARRVCVTQRICDERNQRRGEFGNVDLLGVFGRGRFRMRRHGVLELGR